MTYSVKFSDLSIKQLDKLDSKLRIRIISIIKRIRTRPFAHLKKLVGNPYFRLRVGDYRIIMNVKENKLKIYVIEIGHRSKIYKK